MTRLQIGVLALVAACCLVGCGPSVTVTNNTNFPVRVVLSSSDGSESLSPTPGESSSAEVAEGKYTVSVIPDADWINYAKSTRQYLNDKLANPSSLSGPELLGLVAQLKSIAKKMSDYQNAGLGASCSGTVSAEADGLATVSLGADGKLKVVCK